MPVIKVNDSDVDVSHEVKVADNGSVAVHVTAVSGNVKYTHVVTVGAVDHPIPVGYNLQADLEVARQYAAGMAESRGRAQKLAAALV